MTTDNINYVGSKVVRIGDELNQINFESWILYPCSDKSENIKIGPYCIDACHEGVIIEGKFPLVVISHGSGGSHLLYRETALYLAQQGHIVVMPEHYGNNRNDNSLEAKDSNLTLRTHHIKQVIDTLISDPIWINHIDTDNIFMVGHSMGGCTALAIAGAVPWSVERNKIDVVQDQRIKALVLLAPATPWFQHPDSFNEVNIPIMVYSGEYDNITPYWQADLIKRSVKNTSLVDIHVVKNAGHFSFLSPFPETMQYDDFLPSQDPQGFDRAAFHESLKVNIFNFFTEQCC